jgi:Flp pilus assembly protein TadD
MNRLNIILIFICFFLVSGCEDDSNGPQDVENQINAMLKTGQFLQAEELCQEAILSDPDNPALRTLSGDINLAAGNGRFAEIDFRKAIALGADAARMQTRLARALLR